MNIVHQYIKELALECGFKLKEQPNGDLDLNPYVYTFADKLIKQTHIIYNCIVTEKYAYLCNSI